jgi:hypothetical protein
MEDSRVLWIKVAVDTNKLYHHLIVRRVFTETDADITPIPC